MAGTQRCARAAPAGSIPRMDVTRTSAPAPTLPPLHLRTPEQLKAGMVVEVRGAGSDDLAVARLIQDGAQYVARTAGTTMGLATVTINDRSADAQGALGLATFYGTKGWFGLSMRSTQGVMEGIKRLREKPFDAWTESERQAFIQGNETILHEAGHVTLPAYDGANIGAWRGAPRSFEEGLTEVVTMHRINDFLKDEFAIDVPELSSRITQSTSAYTRYTERIERMLGMGTDGSRARVADAASQVADNVRPDRRLHDIAQRVVTNLGGASAPAQLVDEIARTLEGFVAEQNGTRTKLMTIQAALADHRTGKPVNLNSLSADLRRLDRHNQGVAPGPRVGSDPIE